MSSLFVFAKEFQGGYRERVIRTFRKFIRRVSRYGKTNLLVALHLCHTVEREGCWKRMAGLALRLTSGLPMSPKRRRKMAPIFFKRLRVCRSCPLFNRQFRTCGSPGTVTHDPDGKVSTVGCWCVMVLKSWLPDVTCWAVENGIEGIGWPPELNNVKVR